MCKGLDFLLIFDNVEDLGVLKDVWVDSKYGSLLVTCRNEPIATLSVQNIFHVPFLEDDQGSKFLIKMSDQDATSQQDLKSARELSALLGGLPLGLAIMAMQIRRYKMSMSQFVEFYKENNSRLHDSDKRINLDPFYSHDLATVYKITFEELNSATSQASILMRVICLMSPEKLPLGIFRPREKTLLPSELLFCHSHWE